MSEQNPVRTRSEAELRRIAKLGADELGWEATAEQVVAFAAEHLGADEVAVACSMADAVLPHCFHRRAPRIAA